MSKIWNVRATVSVGAYGVYADSAYDALIEALEEGNFEVLGEDITYQDYEEDDDEEE